MNVAGGSRFEVRSDGVYYVDSSAAKPNDRELRICSKLEVIALSRDGQSERWAKLVRFSDPDGVEHELPLWNAMLADNGNAYRRWLSSQGLRISPDRNARDLLTKYILLAEPRDRVRSVPRLGWHEEVFVLPDITIGKPHGERVVWQSDSMAEHPFKQSGSLDEWRNEVGVRCSGNTRLLFAGSCAFAAPLLSMLGEESMGFHLRGPSSQGKTTALRVAGSVWGGGGRNGYIESWLTTMNGLEAIAERHNDGLLCLDELAQVDPAMAGDTAYLLANGQGKGRMDRTTAARRRLKWSLCFLSSGELSLQAHAKSAGKGVRAGQSVRIIEIAADSERGMGLFEHIHDHTSPDSFARFLSDATLKYYGTPIREFLYLLIHSCGIRDTKEYIIGQRAAFLETYCAGGASGEVSRVAGHFGLIAAAGEMATFLHITGWSDGEATAGAAACFKSWLACRGTEGSSDEEMAVKRVRAFIEANGSSRFQTGNEPVANRVGFKRSHGGLSEYWVLPEAFQNEVCAGFDPGMVAKALDKRGYLRHPDDRLQVKVRLTGGTAWVYAIQGTLFVRDG